MPNLDKRINIYNSYYASTLFEFPSRLHEEGSVKMGLGTIQALLYQHNNYWPLWVN